MRVERLILLASAVLMAAGSVLAGAVTASAGEPDGSIEEFLDSAMPASGVPGLAYAVVTDGRVTAVGARGVLRLGGDSEVTPDTAFVIGSISKSFTALAVMQLVEADRIDLDAEIERYLDGFVGEPAGTVTIRQLLSHTSGLSTLQGNASQVEETGRSDDLERRVDELAVQAPAYGPDERWEYSNANYLILGRLVEVVSGQDYQSYVTRTILVPVGMEHSFVSDGELHDSMATGHTTWFGTRRPVPMSPTSRATAPAGGVVASATDLTRYLQMMMNGQDDVLSAAGKAEMMRPASAASPFYGLGWFLDPDKGTVWHSGVTPGVETLATMLPAEQDGVVVLVNGGAGSASGRRPSSARASPPGRWASTTAAPAPDCRSRPCSSRS